MSTTEEIHAVRRAKEQALEAGDYVLLASLRDQEKQLLAAQTMEFKPNGRGS